MCNVNNDIPVKRLSFPYVLVNRSILYNCGIEAENIGVFFESIAACHEMESKLVTYFTVSMAFVNYLDNLTDSLDIPILQNWATHEQILQISLVI